MAIITSDVDICNLALGYLKIEPITNIETPNSNEARICAKYYDIARQAVLESADWSFATKRASLSADTNTPAFGWTAQSDNMPDDFLKLIGVYNTNGDLYINTNNQFYEFENNRILTDLGAPYYIKYVADVTNVAEFDRLYILHFSYMLAIIMAEAFKTSSTTLQSIFTKWQQIWQPNALAVNGQQNKVTRVNKSAYVDIRQGPFIRGYDNIITS
jgi:hypothetical protein